MANIMRWRYGDTNPVMAPVAPSTAIEIGDLVYLSGGEAWPAATLPDQGTEIGNQNLFHEIFLGVAMQSSSEDDTSEIRIATTGVFEFDCAEATFDVGDFLTVAENTPGTVLLNQTVTDAPSASAAIGRSAERVNPASSRVLVDVISSIMRGGPQPVV